MSHRPEDTVERLFKDAIALPEAERHAYLDRACGGDEALRAEVASLLAADEEAANFLERPTPAPGGDPLIGRRIGRYRIERLIATGGMGRVFEATQDEPTRAVALKVLNADVLPTEASRRFSLEVEILARLHHDAIAQVYEAATYEADGAHLPYFAMEYVERAEPVTDYARRHGLSRDDALGLFLEVCDAVHYAHQRGVIHRDLKPSNILVNETGRPKLIDFGIARLTDVDRTAMTRNTQTGQVLGTLLYMSPEQASGDSADVDVRTDVYSLGLVLYELMTGAMPYDLAECSTFEIPRVIRETPARRPSAHDTTLRGDLEAVLLKAIDKDPARRYQSAAGLARDLRRFRRREPVEAKPPSVVYQLRLFAARHRAWTTAAAITFLALVVATVVSTTFAVRAQRAASAEAAQRTTAETITRFQTEILTSLDPAQRKGREVTVRTLLDSAAARIDRELADEPVAEGAIRTVLGETYRNLGFYEEAVLHLRRALELRLEHFGEQHEDSLETMNVLALSLQDLGRFDEAADLYERAHAGSEQIWGGDDPRTLTLANNLGWLLMSQGRYADAEPILRQTLDRWRRVTGDDDIETIRTLGNLANTLSYLQRYDEATPLFAELVPATRRSLGPDSPVAAYLLASAANFHSARGDLATATALARESLDIRLRLLGPEHPHTFYSIEALASVLAEAGELEEAEVLIRQVSAGRRAALGADHPEAIRSLGAHGNILWRLGRHEDAEALFREAVERWRRTAGPDAEPTLAALHNLGVMLLERDAFDEAGALYRDLLERRQRMSGERHPKIAIAEFGLARALAGRGELERAVELERHAIALAAEVNPGGDADQAGFMYEHVQTLYLLGAIDEAERWARAALEMYRATRSEDSFDTVWAKNMLAHVLATRGAFDEAERLFGECLASLRRRPGDHERDVFVVLFNSCRLLQRQQRLEEAETTLREVLAWRRRAMGDAHADTINAQAELGRVLRARGELEEAERLLRSAIAGAAALWPEGHYATFRYQASLGLVLLDADRPAAAADALRAGLDGFRRWGAGRNLDALEAAAALTEIEAAAGSE